MTHGTWDIAKIVTDVAPKKDEYSALHLYTRADYGANETLCRYRQAVLSAPWFAFGTPACLSVPKETLVTTH